MLVPLVKPLFDDPLIFLASSQSIKLFSNAFKSSAPLLISVCTAVEKSTSIFFSVSVTSPLLLDAVQPGYHPLT